MLQAIKIVLAAIAAFSSMFSGAFWHLSAVAQLKVLELSASTPPATAEAISALTNLSAQENLWAAIAATVSGVALAIAVAL